MRIKGKIYKEGKHWLAQVEALNAMTQGMTKKEALEMIKEYLELQIECYLNKKVVISVYSDAQTLEIEASDSAALFAFLLRMMRISNNKTIAAIKEELGFKSLNSYQAYEYGDREPSLSKIESLLKALNSSARLVVEIE